MSISGLGGSKDITLTKQQIKEVSKSFRDLKGVKKGRATQLSGKERILLRKIREANPGDEITMKRSTFNSIKKKLRKPTTLRQRASELSSAIKSFAHKKFGIGSPEKRTLLDMTDKELIDKQKALLDKQTETLKEAPGQEILRQVGAVKEEDFQAAQESDKAIQTESAAIQKELDRRAGQKEEYVESGFSKKEIEKTEQFLEKCTPKTKDEQWFHWTTLVKSKHSNLELFMKLGAMAKFYEERKGLGYAVAFGSKSGGEMLKDVLMEDTFKNPSDLMHLLSKFDPKKPKVFVSLLECLQPNHDGGVKRVGKELDKIADWIEQLDSLIEEGSEEEREKLKNAAQGIKCLMVDYRIEKNYKDYEPLISKSIALIKDPTQGEKVIAILSKLSERQGPDHEFYELRDQLEKLTNAGE